MVTFKLVDKQSKDPFVPLMRLSLHGTAHIHEMRLFLHFSPTQKKPTPNPERPHPHSLLVTVPGPCSFPDCA